VAAAVSDASETALSEERNKKPQRVPDISYGLIDELLAKFVRFLDDFPLKIIVKNNTPKLKQKSK